MVLIESRHPYPIFAMPFNNMFARWIVGAGPMILGAWIALAFQGRWRPIPTWTDQAGCVLGACFLLIYLYGQIYFDVVLPISHLWYG